MNALHLSSWPRWLRMGGLFATAYVALFIAVVTWAWIAIRTSGDANAGFGIGILYAFIYLPGLFAKQALGINIIAPFVNISIAFLVGALFGGLLRVRKTEGVGLAIVIVLLLTAVFQMINVMSDAGM